MGRLVLLMMAVLPLKANALFLPGDVNGDDEVNITDITMLIQYLLTGTGNIDAAAADINGDDEVNITDVTSLIAIIINEETEPQTETFTIDGVSFTMVKVKGGTFTMGNDGYPVYRPTHEVTLSDFSIGQTEVTQELWLAVMGVNPSWFCSAEGYEDDLMRPVEEVSWYHCYDFIVKLNRLTGRSFRFPTEAEWEFAARGGNKSNHYRYSGSNDLDDVGWYKLNIPSQEEGTAGYGTQRVGLKRPNELGLYDMTGNVWEWCLDWFDYYSSEPQVNPTGPTTGQQRIMRGGSWSLDAFNQELFIHSGYNPGSRFIDAGLRLAL